MMTNATLERVSISYRDGYRDGYADRPFRGRETGIAQVMEPEGPPLRPFADFDYSEGFKAGSNDAAWHDRNRAKGFDIACGGCDSPRWVSVRDEVGRVNGFRCQCGYTEGRS
jgi:hypothetical protein